MCIRDRCNALNVPSIYNSFHTTQRFIYIGSTLPVNDDMLSAIVALVLPRCYCSLILFSDFFCIKQVIYIPKVGLYEEVLYILCHRTNGTNRTTLRFLVTLRRAVWRKRCDVSSARSALRCSAAAPAVRGVLQLSLIHI